MEQNMKPVASLSLDLDNQWSYMKTHGDAGWESFPTYLDLVVPRTLEMFRKHGFTITYFVVGQDAALPENRAALASIARAGHEIGNHSFLHEPWLHLYSDAAIDAEIARAEDAIHAATGIQPTGFRGPGFSVSTAVLLTLRRRGYRYDASTFPTFLGPLARAYYFFTSKLSAEEKAKRKQLFGKMSEGFRPLKPYAWRLETGDLTEIPVTTMPVFRVPFHLSYIIYLACYSPVIARFYFRMALWMCRLFRVEPSLLLHPLDFIGGDDIEAVKFFPGMKMNAKQKLALVDQLFTEFGRQFRVLPMGEHDALIRSRGLRRREPDFGTADASAPGRA
jgi:peptidoglycan-N-acetylglucosamine deacetylase